MFLLPVTAYMVEECLNIMLHDVCKLLQLHCVPADSGKRFVSVETYSSSDCVAMAPVTAGLRFTTTLK